MTNNLQLSSVQSTIPHLGLSYSPCVALWVRNDLTSSAMHFEWTLFSRLTHCFELTMTKSFNWCRKPSQWRRWRFFEPSCLTSETRRKPKPRQSCRVWPSLQPSLEESWLSVSSASTMPPVWTRPFRGEVCSWKWPELLAMMKTALSRFCPTCWRWACTSMFRSRMGTLHFT